MSTSYDSSHFVASYIRPAPARHPKGFILIRVLRACYLTPWARLGRGRGRCYELSNFTFSLKVIILNAFGYLLTVLYDQFCYIS